MLSYNDALSHSQPQSDATCVVCHDLVDSERIIWHEVKMATETGRMSYDSSSWPIKIVVVPICIDCATMFHDVKPAR